MRTHAGVGDEKDENTAEIRATHASQGDYTDVQMTKQHLLTINSVKRT